MRNMPDYWRRDVYKRLPELIKKFGPTFHLYSKPGIMATGGNFNQAFAGTSHRQFFAVKALPEPSIMQFMFQDLGFGFDCSSPGEAVMAWSLGARREDVIYSSNDTSKEEFEFVSKGRGCMLNLDDITFVPMVPNFPETIFFRLKGERLKTSSGNVIGSPRDSKYGITYEQIVPAYRAAMKRGARKFGIHIMVASNDRCDDHFVETARYTLEVAAMLYKKLGIMISRIDIGGGFAIPYRPGDRDLNIYWIGIRISKLFHDFASQFGFRPTLMTECGRYITGPHGILVNVVTHVMRKCHNYIGVPSGMVGCSRPAFYGSYHHQDITTPNGVLCRGRRKFFHVVDPMCENWGRLTATPKETTCPRCGHVESEGGPRLLPASVRPGYIHVTANCGAHSGAMASMYNFRLPIMGLLDQDGTNENVVMIRKPMKIKDVLSLMVYPPGYQKPEPTDV